MPGTFVLAVAVALVVFPLVALMPAIMATWKRRYSLAFMLLLVAIATNAIPWLTMLNPGLGRFLGVVALPLFFSPVWFGVGASLVVLFLSRKSQSTVAPEGPVAPWLQEMRVEIEIQRRRAPPA